MFWRGTDVPIHDACNPAGCYSLTMHPHHPTSPFPQPKREASYKFTHPHSNRAHFSHIPHITPHTPLGHSQAHRQSTMINHHQYAVPTHPCTPLAHHHTLSTHVQPYHQHPPHTPISMPSRTSHTTPAHHPHTSTQPLAIILTHHTQPPAPIPHHTPPHATVRA